jgi:hypothetical protein
VSLFVASSHQASTLLVLMLTLPVTSLFVNRSKLADKLLASQEELCFVKLISWLVGFVKTVCDCQPCATLYVHVISLFVFKRQR